MKKQYCKYFSKKMNLSQSYNEGNHLSHYSDKEIFDYPIDETYGTENGAFLAPFDCSIVKTYQATSNQIWITSSDKVKTPSGDYFVTIFIGHISNEEFKNLKKGQKFSQGDVILHEYKDKLSTGKHNHVSAGLGKIKGTGWKKNKNLVWCLQTTQGVQKPEKIYYVNNTTIQNGKHLNWQTYKEEDNTIYYITLDDLYIRKEPNLGYVKVKDCTEAMKSALKYNKPNDKAVIKKGTTITCLKEVKIGNQLWCKNYNGYVCIKGKKEYMKKC